MNVTATFGPSSSLLFLGSGLGLMLALALAFISCGNKTANGLLSGMLLLCTFALLDGFLFDTGHYFTYPHLFRILPPSMFLISPSASLLIGLVDSRHLRNILMGECPIPEFEQSEDNNVTILPGLGHEELLGLGCLRHSHGWSP